MYPTVAGRRNISDEGEQPAERPFENGLRYIRLSFFQIFQMWGEGGHN